MSNGRTLSREAPPFHFNLGMLFANRNLPLCVAKHVYQPEVRTLRQWQREDLSKTQWLVPNLFIECGLGGRFKTDRNAGDRIWLIVEFDHHTIEEQGRLLDGWSKEARRGLALGHWRYLAEANRCTAG
jgi:hypothetical protein